MPSANLIVTCHPSEHSLCAHTAQMCKSTLEENGQAVLCDDLCRLGFNPVISPQEFSAFYQNEIPADLADLISNLRQARRVIFIYPIWMYDMPALLKGYFERVWRPHIAYHIDGDLLAPLLTSITQLVVIATHGRNEAETSEAGDATRQFFARSLPTLLPNLKSNTRFDFYGLDAPEKQSIETSLSEIRQHLLTTPL